MKNKSKPQGRRGLRPWGLSHQYELHRIQGGLTVDRRAVYTISSIYSYRIKLPPYVYLVYYGELLKENIIERLFDNFVNIVNKELPATMLLKIPEVKFRTTESEITIDIVVPDTEKNWKIVNAQFSRIVRKHLNTVLHAFKAAIIEYLRTHEEFYRYRIIKLDGSPAKKLYRRRAKKPKNGVIR